MVRSIGIDPGTRSFSLFGIEEDKIVLDEDVPSSMVAEEPDKLIEIIENVEADIIVGPSGYGLPLKRVEELKEEDFFLLILRKPEDKGISVLEGLVEFVKIAREKKLPMIFIPSVIQLPTVPTYRKLNKIDMGTADKLAVTVLAVKEVAEERDLNYEDINIIVVEVGGAYTSLIAVRNGRIVDGIGGSQGCIGFMSHGRMDGEVAYLYGGIRKIKLFEGGVVDIIGDKELKPEEFPKKAFESSRGKDAWDLFFEEIEKFFCMMTVSVPKPMEVVLSGRMVEVPEVKSELEERLEKYAPVRKLRGFDAKSKTPAQGSAVIGNGLLGGKYKALIEHMRIKEASGTVLDYVLISNWKENVKKYGVNIKLVYEK